MRPIDSMPIGDSMTFFKVMAGPFTSLSAFWVKCRVANQAEMTDFNEVTGPNQICESSFQDSPYPSRFGQYVAQATVCQYFINKGK